MSNSLTGDYEAVLEVALRQINGILGTLHQNGADPKAALQTPHSTIGRVGDPRRSPPDGGVFEDWVLEFQRVGPGQPISGIQSQLIETAPPGAARLLTDAFAAMRENWTVGNPPPPPETVRGTVQLQSSTVTITVPQGSSSEVTIDVGIRARYFPDSGTATLPEPVHGDVQAAFEIRKIQTRAGTRLLISPSSDDSKIQFSAAPGSGLTVFEQNILTAQIRKVLREQTVLVPVDLPRDFPFTDFKGIGQAIALPFQLSGAPAPASGVQPLTQSFIGSSGFAVAISSDYVTGLIDTNAIQQAIASNSFTITVDLGFTSISATYHLRFTSGPTLTFQSGGIQIAGSVAVETSRRWAPDGSISFTQMIRLMLDTTSQTVTPIRFGDPQVNQSWFIPHDLVVNIVRAQIDSALFANRASIQKVFDTGKTTLAQGLHTFDPFARVSYTGLDITPDGVIVRGEIDSLARRAPVVNVAETDQSSAFTAFNSWIPAGRIDRFIWSWVEYPRFNLFDGVAKSVTDEHRFVLPKPAGATHLDQICLRIEGTQLLPGGQQVGAAGGTTCSIGGLELEMDVPSWWAPLTVPIWRPDLPETTVMRNAIAAHVGVAAGTPGKERLPKNVLVYFADWRSDRPLEVLDAALSKVRNSSALMVLVVVPAGTFDASRREFESRLGSGRDRQVLTRFTEDDEGGWTHMFGAAKKPSAYLINANRTFVWKHEGQPDPAELAHVLNERLTPTSAQHFRPLTLAVSHGDMVPDAFFETDARDQFAIHRFSGREVLLNFWQSWSAPCLAELVRLQRLHESGKGTPTIVAFHGGNNTSALEDVRKRLGLSFALVQDAQQQIARQYGVRCWPTTISVGADGRAEHIQFGMAHEHVGPAGQAASAARPA